MKGGHAGALASMILLVLHGIYLAPALLRHGSSAGFDWAVGIAAFLVFMMVYALLSLGDDPPKKK